MKLKPNHIIIPLITIAVSVGGSLMTTPDLIWYDTLNMPSWQPPKFIFGPVWTTIYILTMSSALLVWNDKKAEKATKRTIMWMFAINAFLNVLWSYIFFVRHDLLVAVWGAGLLGLSVLLLMLLIKPISKKAMWLLAPYLFWVTFATYLSYTIYMLNI